MSVLYRCGYGGITMTEPKWWDCTLNREETFRDGQTNPWSWFKTNELGEWLMTRGIERCVIGEEEGEDGYRHWQMRMVFKKETSFEKVRELIPEGHWTKTSVRDFHYVEKEGHFWRSWEKALACYGSLELWPWQNEVMTHLRTQG
nr:MAG: rep protein [Cressdnaviricota sp.]